MHKWVKIPLNKEGDVGLKKTESGNKGEVGTNLGKPINISSLGVYNKRDLSNLHEIEIR